MVDEDAEDSRLPCLQSPEPPGLYEIIHTSHDKSQSTIHSDGPVAMAVTDANNGARQQTYGLSRNASSVDILSGKEVFFKKFKNYNIIISVLTLT